MIEITTFRLITGADEEAFRSADKTLQSDFAYRQPGLLRRTTASDDRGGWIVIDLWRSDADADTAETRRRHDPLVTRFLSFIDDGTVQRERYQTLD